MKFFNVDVYRDDVLAVLDGLDGIIAPLRTLCDSPRESEQNNTALKMTVETRRYVAEKLASPDLTYEEIQDDTHHPSSAASRP